MLSGVITRTSPGSFFTRLGAASVVWDYNTKVARFLFLRDWGLPVLSGIITRRSPGSFFTRLGAASVVWDYNTKVF